MHTLTPNHKKEITFIAASDLEPDREYLHLERTEGEDGPGDNQTLQWHVERAKFSESGELIHDTKNTVWSGARLVSATLEKRIGGIESAIWRSITFGTPVLESCRGEFLV